MSDNTRDVNKELEALYAKGQDELTHLKRENSMRKPRTKARDLMVHIAVTVMGEVDGRHVYGEKDNEIGQFAVRIPHKWVEKGLSMAQLKMVFEQLSFRAVERMRVSGLTRAGE